MVALCAAAAVWVAYDGQNAAAPLLAAVPVTDQVGAAAAPVTAPVAAADAAPAVAAADDAATVATAVVTDPASAEPDVSTAAILEDVDEPDDKEKTLKEILQTPAPAAVAATVAATVAAPSAAAPKLAANPAPDELTRLLDKPTPRAPLPTAARKSPKRMVDAGKPPAKRAAQKARQKDAEKHRLAVAPSKKNEIHPKASKQIDSDVALLAALVAHSKAYPEKIKPGSTAAKLKQCGKQSSANAGKCRERVCSGSGKDDLECKSVRLAKATVAT